MSINKLLRMVQAREAVDKVCVAIDAGIVQPTEEQLMELALLVNEHGGMLKHDLLCKIASRSKHGRAALKGMAH